jgi:uncharacterized membrane protein
MIIFLIITLLLGDMFSFLGWVIKSQNAGDMINGYNDRIYDKTKVSKIMGNSLLYLGSFIILLGIINIFLDEKYNRYSARILFFSIVVVIIIAVYRIEKYGKKQSNK